LHTASSLYWFKSNKRPAFSTEQRENGGLSHALHANAYKNLRAFVHVQVQQLLRAGKIASSGSALRKRKKQSIITAETGVNPIQ